MNLYLSTYGSKVGISDGRITVVSEGEMIADYPVNSIDSITMLTGVGITPALIKEFSEESKPIFWSNKMGRTYACLYPPGSENILRRKKQYILSDNTDFCIQIAKKNTTSKILNQLYMLGCIFDMEPDELVIEEFSALSDELQNVNTVDEIMGIEGQAARLYFREISRNISPYCMFSRRTRQPPRDMFSSALGFAYMLLYNTYVSEILSSGLDPYVGFVHKLRNDHYALASDMMEGLRPVICDCIVCSMFMEGKLNAEDFETNTEGAVYLKRMSDKKIISEYEKILNQKSSVKARNGIGQNWKNLISEQINTLVKAVESEEAGLYQSLDI